MSPWVRSTRDTAIVWRLIIGGRAHDLLGGLSKDLDLARARQPRSPRLHDTVARRIGTAILSGALAPGAALGGEIEEAEAAGVSRTAYREAVRILVAKGLIESRPRAGTRVTARRRWALLDPEVLEWMFATRPDPRFVADVFELRRVIEPAAAAFAATRAGPAHLAAMDAGLAGMRRHGLATVEGQAADRDFHAAILDATGNETFATLSSSIGAAVRWTTQFKQREGRIGRDSLPEHEALRDAIASRDPDAARRAMEHLLRLAEADMAQGPA